MNSPQALRVTLLERIDREAEGLIALAADLVRIPSENPPGDTRAVCEFAAAHLRARALPFEVHEPAPTMPSLVARIAGAKPGPRLVLNAHMDVFPAGDRARWSVDPFGGVVRHGRIYGRGVSDMKGGLTALLAGFCLLGEYREGWRGELVLTLVSDEETMGELGTKWLLDHVPAARGDALLNADVGSPRVIRIGEKGYLWVELAARGRAAHGAHVHLGDSAVERVLQALTRVLGLRHRQPPVPADILAVIREAQPVSEPEGGPGEAEVLRSLTINVGTIAGGLKVNLVADQCVAALDLRLPPGSSTETLLQDLLSCCRPYGVDVQVLRRFEPTHAPPDTPLFQLLRKNGALVLGGPPVLNLRVGASDARFYRAAGIPAAVYGPRGHGLGGVDEHITIDDLLAVTRVHTLTALDFLTG